MRSASQEISWKGLASHWRCRDPRLPQRISNGISIHRLPRKKVRQRKSQRRCPSDSGRSPDEQAFLPKAKKLPQAPPRHCRAARNKSLFRSSGVIFTYRNPTSNGYGLPMHICTSARPSRGELCSRRLQIYRSDRQSSISSSSSAAGFGGWLGWLARVAIVRVFATETRCLWRSDR